MWVAGAKAFFTYSARDGNNAGRKALHRFEWQRVEGDPMQETSTSGVHNGESGREGAAHVKDRLRAKAAAAGEAVRERAGQARGWTRSQVDGVQSRVEAEPYRATALALGVGLLAGVVLATLVRSGRR